MSDEVRHRILVDASVRFFLIHHWAEMAAFFVTGLWTTWAAVYIALTTPEGAHD